MTARTAVQAFADATSALVEQHDAHDILGRLMRDGLSVLGADAIGVMVRSYEDDVELLGATSHQVSQIELFQIQADKGPCQETIRSGEIVLATGARALVDRWGDVGETIVRAGFQAVLAFPVRWQGRVLGGLNVFRSSTAPAEDELALGQAFADVVSLLLLRSVDLSADDVTVRIRAAIAGRTVLEQAKGVLAHQLGLDLAAAYERLVELAGEEGGSVTATATRVVSQAGPGS